MIEQQRWKREWLAGVVNLGVPLRELERQGLLVLGKGRRSRRLWTRKRKRDLREVGEVEGERKYR
jgi:hypothetical protein